MLVIGSWIGHNLSLPTSSLVPSGEANRTNPKASDRQTHIFEEAWVQGQDMRLTCGDKRAVGTRDHQSFIWRIVIDIRPFMIASQDSESATHQAWAIDGSEMGGILTCAIEIKLSSDSIKPIWRLTFKPNQRGGRYGRIRRQNQIDRLWNRFRDCRFLFIGVDGFWNNLLTQGEDGGGTVLLGSDGPIRTSLMKFWNTWSDISDHLDKDISEERKRALIAPLVGQNIVLIVLL